MQTAQLNGIHCRGGFAFVFKTYMALSAVLKVKFLLTILLFCVFNTSTVPGSKLFQ